MGRMKLNETEKLERQVEIAMGTKAMVVINITTEADLANGMHGEIVGLVLDPQEPDHHKDDAEKICLQFPPAVVIFKPSLGTFPQLQGLQEVLPIFPTERTFPIQTRDGQKERGGKLH